tara:strand:- start:30028 stop:30534 length:507 start_codon:yes stop_codon:yes gene_type:complete
MKKYFFILIALSFTISINAQKTKFSIVGGLQNVAVQGDLIDQGFNTGNNYYIGFGSEFSFSNRSSIYSELTYSNLNGTSYFQLPVLYKYRFSDKTSFLLGPQLGYVSDKNARFVKDFSIGLSAGLRSDFSDKLYGMLRYTYQLNDHYSGPFNTSHKIDMASIGIGFKF